MKHIRLTRNQRRWCTTDESFLIWMPQNLGAWRGDSLQGTCEFACVKWDPSVGADQRASFIRADKERVPRSARYQR